MRFDQTLFYKLAIYSIVITNFYFSYYYMFKKSAASLTSLFWLLAIIDILCIALNKPQIHFFIKPLLMPALILLVFSNKHHSNKAWIIAGLFFSFVGDVMLLVDQNVPLFFILGLASFLINHICYIVCFF